ncbi:MAG TPA: fatty acid oxidation complex subunit alpha FadJ [Gemmatimonadales bacterium]|nr:fatty acid oxidation complex subunit alpha FadJ [Gemmatimonadales bacterium]
MRDESGVGSQESGASSSQLVAPSAQLPAAFTTTIENGIAVVTFDLPGEPVNKLSAAVKTEMEALLGRLREDSLTRAVVLISGKADSFIAGADIEEFTAIKTQDQAERLSFEGQETVSRLETFQKPIVAAIHGACLGGGLEVALACHYRIATDHPKTVLGLPEVQLGLIPGAGGCQRLPRLIGARAALDMILTGKTERAQKALRLGLVDEVVPKSVLRQVALSAADRLARQGLPQRQQKAGLAGLILDRTAAGRQLVYRGARKQLRKKTGGHYPAPLAALEAVRVGLEQGITAGLAEEHRAFGELAVGDVSRKLVQIFFATTALKKDDGVRPGSAVPRQIRRLGVIGSGFMGAGIAGTAVLNVEVDTRLKDSDLTRVGKGLKAATGLLKERLTRRRLTRPQYERLSALLSGGTDFSGFSRADLVIEAVFEELEVKRQVLAEVEAKIRSDTIFATNTSTIPIHQIAARARHPERVLGMHFFSPVDRMPLLEVIPTEATSRDTIVTAVRFGRRMGKTVIVVADRPGFWVNRILSPYLNEAGHLLQEGVRIELIDASMTEFGFPVGPVALLDEVGLDVAHKAGSVMHEAFGDRMKPAASLARMLGATRLGRKNGRGFYHYKAGHKAGVDRSVYPLLAVRPSDEANAEVVGQRLVYSMLNEAALACADRVVRSPRDADIGAIFGIGFPAFRGGPLRMIDDVGPERVVETLYQLQEHFGERFRPAPSLLEMAKSGGRYYPA